MSEEERAEAVDAYHRAGLSCWWLPGLGPFRVSLRELLPLAVRIGIVAALLGLILRFRLNALVEQLDAFPRGRLALLGYEYLFPRVMAAALQVRGIVVAAAQERFLQPFHPGFHLLLDHYLVQGPRPAATIQQNSLCSIGIITITGDLRQPRRSRRRRDGPHRCLILDHHSAKSAFADALAISNSWADKRLFMEDLLRLSADFPEVLFAIRCKDNCWVDLPVFADLAAAIGACPNLELDRDRSLDRSYVLLADSDSVVARHTSLGDQGLAMGIPTLFHHSMNVAHFYAPYRVFTRNYDELCIAFATILRDGHFMDAALLAELRRDLYAQPAEPEPKEKAVITLNKRKENSGGGLINPGVSSEAVPDRTYCPPLEV